VIKPGIEERASVMGFHLPDKGDAFAECAQFIYCVDAPGRRLFGEVS
jgi:hypothetical protein